MPKLLQKNILAITIVFSLGCIAGIGVFLGLELIDAATDTPSISFSWPLIVFSLFGMGHKQWFDRYMIIAPYTIKKKQKMLKTGLLELVICKSIVSVAIVTFAGVIFNCMDIDAKVVIMYLIAFIAMHTKNVYDGYCIDSGKHLEIYVLSSIAYIIAGGFMGVVLGTNMQLRDYIAYAVCVAVVLVIFAVTYKKKHREMFDYYCGKEM